MAMQQLVQVATGIDITSVPTPQDALCVQVQLL